jgi:hypothetical protein
VLALFSGLFDYTSNPSFGVLQIHIGAVQVEKGGRSPTIYRSLNPQWNWTSDPIPLLHLHSPLRLKVFDEDSGEKSDFMGVVTIPLLKLAIDSPQTHELPLRDLFDSRNEQGTLNLTTYLARSGHNVRICRELHTRSASQSNRREPSEFVRTFLHALFEHFRTPQYLRSEIVKSKLVTVVGVEVNEFILYDIVSDLYCFQQQMKPIPSFPMLLRTHQSLRDMRSLELLGKVRRSHQLVRSTNIDLQTGKCRRGPVVPDNLLTLYFNDLSASPPNASSSALQGGPIKLLFTHVHVLWLWVKWVRFAISFWRAHTDAPLLDWVIDSGYRITAQPNECVLYAHNDGRAYHGFMTLDAQKPFRLACIDPNTGSTLFEADLTHLTALNCAADSSQPGAQVLRITGLQVYNHNNIDRLDQLSVKPPMQAWPVTGGSISSDTYRVTLKCRSAYNWSTEHLTASANASNGQVIDVHWETPVDIDIHGSELKQDSSAGLDIMVFKRKHKSKDLLSDDGGSKANKVTEIASSKDEFVCSGFLPFRTLVRNAHSNTRVNSAELSIVKANLKARPVWKIALIRAKGLPVHGGLQHLTATLRVKCKFKHVHRDIYNSTLSPRSHGGATNSNTLSTSSVSFASTSASNVDTRRDGSAAAPSVLRFMKQSTPKHTDIPSNSGSGSVYSPSVSASKDPSFHDFEVCLPVEAGVEDADFVAVEVCWIPRPGECLINSLIYMFRFVPTKWEHSIPWESALYLWPSLVLAVLMKKLSYHCPDSDYMILR